MFTGKEIEYIKSQRLARIATASSFSHSDVESSQPDVAPVGFDFDGEYFYVGGINILKSIKYKNILKNNKVALVIDDLKATNPWEPHGIRIYGIRIKPTKKWGWGIDEPVFVDGKFNVKKSTKST